MVRKDLQELFNMVLKAWLYIMSLQGLEPPVFEKSPVASTKSKSLVSR